jgi:hypothetical protein
MTLSALQLSVECGTLCFGDHNGFLYESDRAGLCGIDLMELGALVSDKHYKVLLLTQIDLSSTSPSKSREQGSILVDAALDKLPNTTPTFLGSLPELFVRVLIRRPFTTVNLYNGFLGLVGLLQYSVLWMQPFFRAPFLPSILFITA